VGRDARYQEIADDLRRRLAAGEWPVGGALPCIAALQAEYDVGGLNTIRHAQYVLRTQGLLELRRGRGAKVLALPTPDASEREQLRQVVTDLQRALATAQTALNRVARQLDDATSERASEPGCRTR
jgi:DNA-binding GntR family transcriptional regulator